MKRFALFLCCGVFVFALGSCSSDIQSQPESTPEITASPEPTPEPTPEDGTAPSITVNEIDPTVETTLTPEQEQKMMDAGLSEEDKEMIRIGVAVEGVPFEDLFEIFNEDTDVAEAQPEVKPQPKPETKPQPKPQPDNQGGTAADDEALRKLQEETGSDEFLGGSDMTPEEMDAIPDLKGGN